MTATSSGVFEANWSFMIEPGLSFQDEAEAFPRRAVGIDNESDQVS
jgi:hypothetical protein